MLSFAEFAKTNAALSLLRNEKDKSDFTAVESARGGNQKPIMAYFDNWDNQCNYLKNELKKLIDSNNINSTVILSRSHVGLNKIKYFLDSVRNMPKFDIFSSNILISDKDLKKL